MSGQPPCEVSWKLNKFEYAGGGDGGFRAGAGVVGSLHGSGGVGGPGPVLVGVPSEKVWTAPDKQTDTHD